MTGRQVNIYLQEKTYNAVRQLVGPRQISRYINQAVEERLAYEQKNADEELRRQLIAGYKANAKNKKLQAELGIWEKISTHDVLTQIENNVKFVRQDQKNERKKGKKAQTK